MYGWLWLYCVWRVKDIVYIGNFLSFLKERKCFCDGEKIQDWLKGRDGHIARSANGR